MTVRELIEELQTKDPTAIVVIMQEYGDDWVTIDNELVDCLDTVRLYPTF